MRGTDPLPDTGRKNKQEEKGEMGITTFAAIDVGSYNVCMDIYEMSPEDRDPTDRRDTSET